MFRAILLGNERTIADGHGVLVLSLISAYPPISVGRSWPSQFHNGIRAAYRKILAGASVKSFQISLKRAPKLLSVGGGPDRSSELVLGQARLALKAWRLISCQPHFPESRSLSRK